MNNSIDFKPSRLRGLILDMDGVLWRDSNPIGNLPAIFDTIKRLGYRVVLATNNATRSSEQYVEKLAGFGVTIEPWQVVNSAMATANYLLDRFPTGANIYIIGEPALVETIKSVGFTPSEADPVAVVVGLDRTITYEKLTTATLLIMRGIPFIGTNPDKSFPIPGGQAPGAGSLLAALEATTGVSPVVIGKPQPQMYQVALKRLGTLPDETLVVGDRLETDIAGAQNAGCRCALVLSGVTVLETARKWQPAPDLISEDLTSLLASLSPQLGGGSPN